MDSIRRPLLLAFCLALGARAPASDTRFSSGPDRASLIELYTSEGCSSCPPAEDWLDSLRGDPGLWKRFVPVAFHVSYWDDLGWPDRFAKAAYTRRQYALAASWSAASVYTPCLVRDGAEWRPAPGGSLGSGGRSGILTAEVHDDGTCDLAYVPPDRNPRADWHVHASLLGGGLTSRVTAGENRGATLRHEFTVLALVECALSPDGAGAKGRIVLPRIGGDGVPRLAFAAWITQGGALAPLQATGGWLR